ncbi:hypothetical protein NMY22_g8803 [Coprinellus aureogranulatus]|nr:hypothetical protein NMY22_g8803 [Coprinellus aureogranulatus]
MGRPAKYFTKEERLQARRSERAKRAAMPGGREKRSEENRRAYLRRRGIQHLNEPTQPIPERILKLSESVIIAPGYSKLFSSFRDGRDILGLDEMDIEEADLEVLTGEPPYPPEIVSLSAFSDEWPSISAAMHGYATRRYLGRCDALVTASIKTKDHVLIFELIRDHDNLFSEYQRIIDALRAFQQDGEHAQSLIAQQNSRWYSRLIRYSHQDIEMLRKGGGELLKGVMERKWQLEHSTEGL